MSKWLRRGFGNNTPGPNHPDDSRGPDSTSEFPEPPRNNDMPAAAAAAYGNHQQSSQHLVGYGASPASVAMDVENPQNQRSKYASHHSAQYQAPNSNSNKAYESSSSRGGRSSRARDEPDEGHRSRSGRSSSRGNSNRPRSSQTSGGSSHGQYQSRQGSTNAPSTMTPTSQHFNPPGQQYGQRGPSATPPPPDSMQPSYPPPAVTSESPPPPQEHSHRRPAYLLHRDLVIGKGSYGQVCIASRGEAEGHSAGRSGKRKKFACKCVMLRNDPKYIAKLQEEVNVLRELRGHENVIRLYDVFCVDNELFIITELGRGGDLFHLLTTHPKHGVTEAYAGMFLPATCQTLLYMYILFFS